MKDLISKIVCGEAIVSNMEILRNSAGVIDSQVLYRFFFFLICMYLSAVLGLCCCAGFSLVAKSGHCSLVAVHWLLIPVAASLVAEHRP